ncbi:MAG: hypothetical protein ACRECW_19270 [Phyllobacterium sp.]
MIADVGGVTAGDMGAYMQAGIRAFGLGDDLAHRPVTAGYG